MEKSELYRFSSLIPKVKKSIKKYKKDYNSEFLLTIWNKNILNLAPQKFLQPIKVYRFYGDIVTLDNPLLQIEDIVHQLTLQSMFKHFAKIEISNMITIHFEEQFSQEYNSIDLFQERLNSLGNCDAHRLSESLNELKQFIPQTSEGNEIPVDFNHYKSYMFNMNELLSEEEMLNYQLVHKNCKTYLEKCENAYSFHMTKIFIKKEPYLKNGPIFKEIKFNRAISELFMNKPIEEFTNEDAIRLLEVSAVSKLHYFEFFKGMIKHLETCDCEFSGGLNTIEEFRIPCQEKLKKIVFNSQNYDEIHFFLFFAIEQQFIDKIKEFRLQKKIEEQNKIDVKRAKLKTKFKKIQNIESDSWKTLCVLYYGNSEIEEEEHEKSVDYNEIFWENVDQMKVCKYREIKKMKESV